MIHLLCVVDTVTVNVNVVNNVVEHIISVSISSRADVCYFFFYNHNKQK